MKHIIAAGGGGFSMEPDNLALDQYIIQQSGKPHPKVCFLPTASADSEEYTLRFFQAFLKLGCQPAYLSLFKPHTADLAGFLLEHDVIYVSGGSTRALLALWREFELDVILHRAYETGIILAGLSAGANCWFEGCSTDSLPGSYQVLQGLGFLKGSFCPHYDGEPERAPSFREMIRTGQLEDGYAAEDGVGLHFVDGELAAAVSSRPQARAYRVEKQGNAVEEEPLETRYLG
jgi:dipeptidase E